MDPALMQKLRSEAQDGALFSKSSGSAGAKGVVTAYIALGSNMGDRIAMIEQACREMDARGINVKRTSSLWETEPMYVLEQDRFVNGACEVETDLEPLALLDALQDIERSMGRRKEVDKGPRNIDLDILLYGDRAVAHPRLTVPHAGLAEREFALRPLAELVPDRPLDPARPWRLVQDYLNALPPARGAPLSTLTPLGPRLPPLRALHHARATHVMAILNVTPDSFSDGGALLRPRQEDDNDPVDDPDARLRAAVLAAVRAGATLLDVGGQSTAPRAPQVSEAEERARVVPAVRLIRALPEAAGAAVSVDTYRASVARAALAAGADVVNDVSGGTLDPDLLPAVAQAGATLVVMHMRGDPATMGSLAHYPEESSTNGDGHGGGVVAAVARELSARVRAAERAGVRRWRIVLDPGLGFAKVGAAQNLELLRGLPELRRWPGLEGLPWLLGSSRKSFVGQVTGVAVPADRAFGTATTVAAAVHGGADVVRVHDVAEMAQVVKMADAIWRC
ncbi:Dihydropteroate synthase [Xylariaceae sp. FL0804]|nr:Dihydropteroate synthase [Xylariaceae sp. FL0804]